MSEFISKGYLVPTGALYEYGYRY